MIKAVSAFTSTPQTSPTSRTKSKMGISLDKIEFGKRNSKIEQYPPLSTQDRDLLGTFSPDGVHTEEVLHHVLLASVNRFRAWIGAKGDSALPSVANLPSVTKKDVLALFKYEHQHAQVLKDLDFLEQEKFIATKDGKIVLLDKAKSFYVHHFEERTGVDNLWYRSHPQQLPSGPIAQIRAALSQIPLLVDRVVASRVAP